jgi:hypothetical protein
MQQGEKSELQHALENLPPGNFVTLPAGSAISCASVSEHTLWFGFGAKPFLTISPTGKVTLDPSADLSQLRTLPLWALYALRELVNIAIYDQEKEKHESGAWHSDP